MNPMLKLLFVLLFGTLVVLGFSLHDRNTHQDTGGCETEVDLKHCVRVKCVVLELRQASSLIGINREALLRCDDGSTRSTDQDNHRVGDTTEPDERDYRRLRW